MSAAPTLPGIVLGTERPKLQKVSTEKLIEVYRRTRSVWKTAKELGIIGQSVHERLRRANIPMPTQEWDEEELAELASLAGTMPIGEIGRRLNRTYAAVATKLSRLAIPAPGVRAKKLPRGAGFDKVTVLRLMSEAEAFEGPITRFCRSRGLCIETFVLAAQKHCPDRWDAYTRGRYPVEEKVCGYCQRRYVPASGKQTTCSRACTKARRVDASYFGGKRRQTIGLAERVCQLCRKQGGSLSSHHMLGKENDPENDYLVALCAGCHALVGTLAGRKFADDPKAWEDLIGLCMARRMAEHGGLAGVKGGEIYGTYVCVEMEYNREPDEDEE